MRRAVLLALGVALARAPAARATNRRGPAPEPPREAALARAPPLTSAVRAASRRAAPSPPPPPAAAYESRAVFQRAGCGSRVVPLASDATDDRGITECAALARAQGAAWFSFARGYAYCFPCSEGEVARRRASAGHAIYRADGRTAASLSPPPPSPSPRPPPAPHPPPSPSPSPPRPPPHASPSPPSPPPAPPGRYALVSTGHGCGMPIALRVPSPNACARAVRDAIALGGTRFFAYRPRARAAVGPVRGAPEGGECFACSTADFARAQAASSRAPPRVAPAGAREGRASGGGSHGDAAAAAADDDGLAAIGIYDNEADARWRARPPSPPPAPALRPCWARPAGCAGAGSHAHAGEEGGSGRPGGLWWLWLLLLAVLLAGGYMASHEASQYCTPVDKAASQPAQPVGAAVAAAASAAGGEARPVGASPAVGGSGGSDDDVELGAGAASDAPAPRPPAIPAHEGAAQQVSSQHVDEQPPRAGPPAGPSGGGGGAQAML
ncbi:hypothetical protein KFE25_001065 [Diacronema lutheri]|uniref:Uncharacterized protein n=2 Tax=Diacronema lutheri TaxID=2081491 RepID=A0A8J5X9P5_DIALT|nr:hypothetical protein KFE25_001065 [Diacronema lutheri]